MLSAIDVPLALVALFGALHLLGEQRAVRLLGRPRSRRERWRSASFYVALALIVGALATPIDTLADKLFWVHMVQHVMLLTIAAPLIVLGAPWLAIWRPLPLGLRRSLAKAVRRSPWWAPARNLGALLARPMPAWIAFNVNLVLWHVPVLYDLAVRHRAVHDLEHTTFLLFGVLLWAQVLDSPPLRLRLGELSRVWYMLAAGVVSWVLSLVLVFASSPLYPLYARLAHRPGGLSALADQQIAAGVMLVPGSLALTLFVFVQLYVWIGRGEKTEPPRATVGAPRPEPGPNGTGPTPSAEPDAQAEIVRTLTSAGH